VLGAAARGRAGSRGGAALPAPGRRGQRGQAGGLTLAGRGTQPVEVVDYDRDWPRRYAEERDRIAAAIGASALAMEHVGGTPVPGLPAKPVIDLMIGVDDI